jgi:hypothetical protein
MHSLDASLDVVALEADLARAGCAWACPYSSSDEFEAAVIRARRRAGAYGRMRRRYALYAGIATGMLAVLAFLMNALR